MDSSRGNKQGFDYWSPVGTDNSCLILTVVCRLRGTRQKWGRALWGRVQRKVFFLLRTYWYLTWIHEYIQSSIWTLSLLWERSFCLYLAVFNFCVTLFILYWAIWFVSSLSLSLSLSLSHFLCPLQESAVEAFCSVCVVVGCLMCAKCINKLHCLTREKMCVHQIVTQWWSRIKL